MGVGAQNDLGGHQSFAFDLEVAWQINLFFREIEVISKKKGLNSCWDGFLFSTRNIQVGKLAQNFDAKLPKKY